MKLGDPSIANELAQRVFVRQDERPAHLRPLDITALDPFLRSLLFADGTLTRALEAQMLSRVSVLVLDQSSLPIPAESAPWLAITPLEESIRRRVVITIESQPACVGYAESYLVPQRLPPEFVLAIRSETDGIGETLQQLRLETRRELLWFGLGGAAGWTWVSSSDDVLVRVSRLIVDNRPAILITEGFLVEPRDGGYGMVGDNRLRSVSARPAPNSASAGPGGPDASVSRSRGGDTSYFPRK